LDLRVDMFFQIIIIVCQLSKYLRYEYSRVSAAPGTLKGIVSLFFENLTRCPKVNCSNNLLLKFSKFSHMDQNIKRKVSPIQWNHILASMIYFDSDMSKSANTVVYFDWKTVIYIYVCGKCRTQFMLLIHNLWSTLRIQ
jgi:hypothetical protein